jgi:hypothetical protein
VRAEKDHRQVRASGTLNPGLAARPRLTSAEVAADDGGRTRVEVILEYGNRQHIGRAAGVEDELRLAAEAALSAVEQVARRPGYFHLVGVRRIQAFDAPAVLVSIRTTDERSLRLLGCVPAEMDLVGSVARSVLKATNRLVEGLLAEPNL